MGRGGYSQRLTLLDIFNDKKLSGKIPLINYKERETEEGKTSRTTSVKSVPALVFDVSKKAARPHYKPLNAKKAGNTIDISGTLVSSYDEAYEAIYGAISAARVLMIYTANNADIIRSALKEAQNAKRTTGREPKLFLRAGSLEEIEGMSTKQLQALMNNIMENIYYSDEYAVTRKKYGLEGIPIGGLSYEVRQANWKARVGE